MATPDELRAIAPTLPVPNDEIIMRAAKYLDRGDRAGLEIASNLVDDALTNLKVRDAYVPGLLVGYSIDLRQDRIETYGAVGRPADMDAPYWRNGW